LIGAGHLDHQRHPRRNRQDLELTNIATSVRIFMAARRYASIEDFKEIFNIRRIPDEDEYETLGGFVMTSLGRVPKPADRFEWTVYRFEVMDMDGNRVDKVLVTTLPPKTPPED
jgi:putative hemolysin